MTELERESLKNELQLAWSKADSIWEHIEWLHDNMYIDSLDEGLAPYIKVKHYVEQEASKHGITLKF
ncbi:hypothetical protein vBBceHLY2_00132 [Bacillus phage vB_BceH_LY2]|nr:hypothetical protein vBBceHLY2_00132 [Bacillus phage vB_BceH_LY2]